MEMEGWVTKNKTKKQTKERIIMVSEKVPL
jgi:hypothetical protein